ncbi:hypothetical protein [Kribbella italica]|uniref:Uncharacterized protein n=1 Tax=Kribbella italica TaxID=1540520 RepID=A0A7W9J6E2_9ACTN|nr:hypothetical protein [Kribbella italica]MBB5836452.1 hypothetical protein [Kribbella italica]
MRALRPSSENEMVATFLNAELTSPRFKASLTETLRKHGHSEALLTTPDLANPTQNELRLQLLGDYRGYRQNRELFTDFPDSLSWQLVMLTPSELLDVLYINYSYWTALTNGTRRPTDAVPFIRRGGLVFDRLPTDNFLNLATNLRNGATWPPLICVRATTTTDPLVVLEGHARLTAMALAPDHIPHETPVLLATSPAITAWPCY